MMDFLLNSSTFPFLKDVIIIFLKTVAIMVPCVVGSLVRYSISKDNAKLDKKMYIIYSIVPSFILSGIISKIVSFDMLLGLSAAIGLVSKDLTEGASNISGLLKTYNLIVKIISAVKDGKEIEFDENDIPSSEVSIEHKTETEDKESKTMIKYESSNGELEIKDKND